MIHVKIPEFHYSDKTILKNIRLELESGNTYGVVGLNGAGKTTFFQIMGGFLKAPGIEVTLNGRTVSRKDLAYIDTDIFFYPKITAKEFLSVFPATNANYKEQELATLLNLPLDMLTEEFSTGMKKKLLLLSQIKQDKTIFILDEPFNGLDLETNKLLEVIIAILNSRGKTVFVSSHILNPLMNICHSIHYLKDQTVFRSYNKTGFGSIEEDLFGNYTRNAREELSGII